MLSCGIRCALFLFFIAAACAAEPAVFAWREIERGVVDTATFLVSTEAGGIRITDTAVDCGEVVVQDLLCDSTYATLWWSYRKGSKTRFSARRTGDTIEISGMLLGRPIEKKLTIDDCPWYQIVPMGVQSVAMDSAGRSKYWAVSLREPALLKAVCFRVISITDTALSGRGRNASRRVRVRIQGLPARIWTGDYFVKADDGVFERFEGYSFGSGKPKTIIEAMVP